MLTPEKLSKIANNKVVDIYVKLNEDLTNEIIKKLKKDGDLSSFTKAQIRTLKKQGGKDIFYKSLEKVQGITKKRIEEVNNIFNETKEEQIKDYEPQYEYKDVEFDLDDTVKYYLDRVIKRTNKELKNMNKTIAFRSQETYVKAVDELYMKVISGSFDYDKAIKSVVNDLTNKGITLKSNGRNYSLESTVKMNLFTSLKQTADEISKRIKDDIKADAVWIAPTPYCRPSHKVINGVVMDLKEFKKYEYLTGEPNCYHIVNYVVKKAFEPPLSKSEIRKANTNLEERYNNRQKQNQLARNVRMKKKEIASLKTSNSELLKKKKKELRNAQSKYRVFSTTHGFDVDYSQTWEAGYNGNRNR